MNILSIDMDSLFDGHTYARHTNFDAQPQDTWAIIDYLENTGRYGINTKVDKKALNIICDIINNKAHKSPVRIIDEHNEIIDIISSFNVKEANIYNIDAHHDINYGNDNSTLDLENWVSHAKSNGMMDKYYWICRPLSDVRCDSPFQYNRDCLYDIDLSLLPDFDLVVICISHHFTPMRYWNKLTDVLLSYCNQELNYFKEIHKNSIPRNLFEEVDDYLIDGTLPNIDRVFVYKDCYIILEKDEDNALSIINKGKGFGISVGVEVVDLLLKEYGYLTFTYDTSIRNSILVERVLKRYNIIEDSRFEFGNRKMRTVKFKKYDNI